MGVPCYSVVLEYLYMPAKGRTNVKRVREVADSSAETTDPTIDIGGGDFTELPGTLEPALGAVIRVCVRKGGYFGLSVTDDGGSAKLTVRTGRVTVDRRFYKLADFTAAIAKIFASLRD